MPDDRDLIQRVKDCLKRAYEAESSQREREREDLAFQVPEFQWDEVARQARRGDTSTGALPRPTLSVSLLQQPLRLVRNQASSARLGVKIHPVSEDADKETAEVLEGLYRRIERDSLAEVARLWAFDRAQQCGRGWYRIITAYDEDSEDTWDQEIRIERLLYQDSVYIDPGAEEADFSDAEWAVLTRWVPKAEFERLYPKAENPSVGAAALLGITNQEPLWVRGDGTEQAFLVAEYFWKVHDYQKVELKDERGEVIRTREIDKVSVKWAKVTAAEVLEETLWPGKWIPLVPVIGVELQNFDGERRWEGMVRPARDGQRFFNMAVSTAVERMGMEPKSPWVMAEGQDEGHRDEWKLSNVTNLPVLHYKPTAMGGQLAPPPQRTPIDSSGTSLAFVGMEQAKQLVQSATAIYDPSLGNLSTKERSGRAIQALQQQADAGTSNYLWNLANVSMRYEARVILDLIPHIYDRPGRVTQLLGLEGDERTVMLNMPFAEGMDGMPVPAQPGWDQDVKHYDLSSGRYSVAVNVGRSYQTRLEEGAAEIGDMLPNLPPPIIPLLLPLYLKFRDFPGAKEMGELLTKYRDQMFPGLDDDKPTPEQAMARAQAAEQQVQMLSQQLQAAVKSIEGEQAKQEAMLLKTKMEVEARERIAMADNQTKLVLAGKDAKQAEDLAMGEQAHEARLQQSKQQHESVEKQADRTHEMTMTAIKPLPIKPKGNGR